MIHLPCPAETPDIWIQRKRWSTLVDEFKLEYGVKFLDAHSNDIVDDTLLSRYLHSLTSELLERDDRFVGLVLKTANGFLFSKG